MEAMRALETCPERQGHAPRFAFLVSTTGCARDIRLYIGAPAYSYYFVLEALAPVLERFGTWQLVEQPESRLPYLAARAAAEGLRPVHLALNPPQDAYFTPAVPTVLFPFWEFPRIPDRDFGLDSRQNWARVAQKASLVLTACGFTAAAFQRTGLPCPVAVVPVPLGPEQFLVPDWDPTHSWALACRHLVWGGVAPEGGVAPHNGAAHGTDQEAHARSSTRAARVGRDLLRKASPWLGPEAVSRLVRLKRELAKEPNAQAGQGGRPASRKPVLVRLAYLALRSAYRKHLRPWVSEEGQRRINRVRAKVLRLVAPGPEEVLDPLLPSAPLRLQGLVYTTFLNVGDLRKNYGDLLSAFLIAFRDRPDVTLVIKLASNPVREHNEVSLLRQRYEGLGLEHRCRVVVITEFLSDAQLRELLRVTTYYVNTSHAEGACLPLQQALAGGRPVLAPAHSAMADYIDSKVAFVLESHPEPAPWPHDPERRLDTFWNRLVWASLHDKFRASAALAEHDRARYATMAAAGQRRMREHASRPVVEEALRSALELLPHSEIGAFSWDSERGEEGAEWGEGSRNL
jgi:glycosyltransferase involved in cell wall biosynthesis